VNQNLILYINEGRKIKMIETLCKRQKLECIKQFVGDKEQYGIDFIAGNIYEVDDIDDNGIYIITESGSSVLLNAEEINKIFING
jgi:hypothetical protein